MRGKNLRLAAALGLVLSLTACAGPSTPFGALNGLGLRVDKLLHTRAFGEGPRIRFTPRRQVLHDRVDFDVTVEDPLGIPKDYRLRLLYNAIDVSDAFLGGARESWSGPDRHTLTLTVRDLRLPPTREHDIQVVYSRDWVTPPAVADFGPPRCSPRPETDRKLAGLPDYDPPALTLQTINRQARAGRLNPYLVAGLIAQESGFDPAAVSRKKALGLTQITSIVETELLKADSKWPRYPGLDAMTALEVRLAIATGRINADNEWRLNPEYSIQGGVAYLGYVGEYWSRRERREQVEHTFEGRDTPNLELWLASYHSGPARVARALERRGLDWLEDDELNEGKRYVRRVVSYCDRFAQAEAKGDEP